MVPFASLSDGWAVLLSSALWFSLSVLVGWRSTRWPRGSLDRTGLLTTLRRWEDDGRTWHRLTRVRRWKGRIPEAGAFFAEGRSMKGVGSRSSEDLKDFRASTVRAERVHWLILASAPIHLIWCRAPLGLGMIIFGVAFNAPCIITQRYNRGALDRVLRRQGRPTGTRRPLH